MSRIFSQNYSAAGNIDLKDVDMFKRPGVTIWENMSLADIQTSISQDLMPVIPIRFIARKLWDTLAPDLYVTITHPLTWQQIHGEGTPVPLSNAYNPCNFVLPPQYIANVRLPVSGDSVYAGYGDYFAPTVDDLSAKDWQILQFFETDMMQILTGGNEAM